ncbi:hypothetical protein BDR07DRAFT_151499 [Suillus spraguei]|nr:hypothetical protein BDR07DRAFT_151499 [Suillus spraguei]
MHDQRILCQCCADRFSQISHFVACYLQSRLEKYSSSGRFSFFKNVSRCHSNASVASSQTFRLHSQSVVTGRCGASSSPFCFTRSHFADQPLLYVQYYEIVGHPRTCHQHASRLCYNVGDQRVRLDALIPLTDVMRAVDLIPGYDVGAGRRVSAATDVLLPKQFLGRGVCIMHRT